MVTVVPESGSSKCNRIRSKLPMSSTDEGTEVVGVVHAVAMYRKEASCDILTNHGKDDRFGMQRNGHRGWQLNHTVHVYRATHA